MLETSEVQLLRYALHYTGNQSNDEQSIVSKEIIEPSEEIASLLNKYFFKGFSKVSTTSRFGFDSNPEENIIYSACQKIFNDPDHHYPVSIEILNHLYNQSVHPHIKPGELCVAHFDQLILEGELVEAIGIFKSEIKESFLSIEHQNSNLFYKNLKGINLNKLDKGCLVFNVEKEEGFRVMHLDANNYDAQYWKDDFLQLIPESIESVQTKYALEMVQQFANEVLAPQEDKKEQLAMLNKSVQYFQEEESFNEEQFTKKVLQTPEYIEAFKDFRPVFEEERGIETASSFDIEASVVNKAKKKMNNLIKLDNHIQIKLDFEHPEVAEKYIEKGYDEVKGMHYYVVYFNNEVN